MFRVRRVVPVKSAVAAIVLSAILMIVAADESSGAGNAGVYWYNCHGS